jgi:hypothetical protein
MGSGGPSRSECGQSQQPYKRDSINAKERAEPIELCDLSAHTYRAPR